MSQAHKKILITILNIDYILLQVTSPRLSAENGSYYCTKCCPATRSVSKSFLPLSQLLHTERCTKELTTLLIPKGERRTMSIHLVSLGKI